MATGALRKIAAVKVADRRHDIRFDGSINGCYTLSRRRVNGSEPVEVFACRTRSISCVSALVTAPVLGEVGEVITMRLDGLGIMRGQIEQQTEDGFLFGISASDSQRTKLADRIESLKRKNLAGAAEKRGYRRQQPRDPRSTITLADGEVMRCFVIDYSRSGAAVSADHAPEIGAPLVLGLLACKVVRHLEVGFSVKFDADQEAEGLEPLISGFEPQLVASERAVAAEA